MSRGRITVSAWLDKPSVKLMPERAGSNPWVNSRVRWISPSATEMGSANSSALWVG